MRVTGWIQVSVVILCCTLMAAESQAQSFGVELHNNLMHASGGIAGTSLARPQDLQSAINANPATLTRFRGTQFSFGGAWADPAHVWPHSVVTRGQSADGGGGDLAALAQNPIASLASIPLQNNFDFGVGPVNRTRYAGNLQPVFPWRISEDWNLITRFIVPCVNSPIGLTNRSHGLGDTVGQFFLSPQEPGAIIWGVGPAFIAPTASDATLGFQTWGAGVTGVALVSEGPIVGGLLVHQIWGEAASTQPLLLQPFFNYNLRRGWFINVSGEATADWQQPASTRWTFPFGAGIGRTFPLGGQPISIKARFAPYLAKPTGGPDWQFQLSVSLLFPK